MTSPANRVIAIDGPAASGKSSVARELARQIGFVYLNSGAIYRALTWAVLRKGIDVADAAAVSRFFDFVGIRVDLMPNDPRIRIDQVDASPHLREEKVNAAVSQVSAIPAVRRIADEQMHRYAETNDLVVEGRDIGSVVFPNTPYKFYIDASPEVRARRRAAEGVIDEISARDRADSLRAAAPLVIADDAEVIDTSAMTIDEVVDRIITRLRRKKLEFGTAASIASRTS